MLVCSVVGFLYRNQCNFDPYLCFTALLELVFLAGKYGGLWLVNVGRNSSDCTEEGCSLASSGSEFCTGEQWLDSLRAVWFSARSDTIGPSLKIKDDEWTRLACSDNTVSSVIVSFSCICLQWLSSLPGPLEGLKVVVLPSTRQVVAVWSTDDPRWGTLEGCICLGASTRITSPCDISSLWCPGCSENSVPGSMLHSFLWLAPALDCESPLSSRERGSLFLSLQICNFGLLQTERFSWDWTSWALFPTQVESSVFGQHSPLSSELQKTDITKTNINWNVPLQTKPGKALLALSSSPNIRCPNFFYTCLWLKIKKSKSIKLKI